MSLSKMDRKFPSRATGQDEGSRRFAAAIAAALHETFGDGGSAIKTVARLTSVNQRTVKNWFQATNSPRGDHLIMLVAKSSGMLDALLTLAGRDDLVVLARATDLHQRLIVVMRMFDETLTGK